MAIKTRVGEKDNVQTNITKSKRANNEVREKEKERARTERKVWKRSGEKNGSQRKWREKEGGWRRQTNCWEISKRRKRVPQPYIVLIFYFEVLKKDFIIVSVLVLFVRKNCCIHIILWTHTGSYHNAMRDSMATFVFMLFTVKTVHVCEQWLNNALLIIK